MGNYEASLAVRYVVMTASLGCSILTSAVVVVEKLSKETFPQLILIMQIEYALIALLDMLFPSYSRDVLACEVIGYIILSLWISSFLLTLFLLLIIERRLCAKSSWLNTIHRQWKFIIAGAVVLPFLINLIPIKQFKVCGLGDMLYYCSLCGRTLSFWIAEFSITILILCIALVLFCQITAHCKNSAGFTHEQQLAVRVVTIPQANFVILLLNLVTKTIDYSSESWMFWVYVAVNMLFYIVPIVNLRLFVTFMKEYPCPIYHFTWLIRQKPDSDLRVTSYVEM